MTTETIIPEKTTPSETAKQSLLNIVRTLPPERILQLLDFAQFLARQANHTHQPSRAEFDERSNGRSNETPLIFNKAWPDFVEQSYGCLANAPIEYPMSQQYEIRKAID